MRAQGYISRSRSFAATGQCKAATRSERSNPRLFGRSWKSDSNAGPRQLGAWRRSAGGSLTQCHVAAKRFAEAGVVLAQLEKEFPADADVLYVSAGYHMKAWNDAIYRMYQKAPSSYRVDERLSAEVFEDAGQVRRRRSAEYRKAIGKNPKAIDLHYRLGRALLQQSHDPAILDEARKEFEVELGLNCLRRGGRVPGRTDPDRGAEEIARRRGAPGACGKATARFPGSIDREWPAALGREAIR